MYGLEGRLADLLRDWELLGLYLAIKTQSL